MTEDENLVLYSLEYSMNSENYSSTRKLCQYIALYKHVICRSETF